MLALVVDDSRAMRSILTRLLTNLGFDVAQAGDGAEALSVLNSGARPEVILVDWNMPVLGGVEFLAELRGSLGGTKPKVVFCASENDVAHIARAMRAGADDYILKPFDREIVEAKLQEVGLL